MMAGITLRRFALFSMFASMLVLSTGCDGQIRAIQNGVHAGTATIASGVVTSAGQLALELLLSLFGLQ